MALRKALMTTKALADVNWKNDIRNYYPFRESSPAENISEVSNRPESRTIMYHITCPGGKLPVRSIPSVKGDVLSYLKTGAVVAVYPTTKSGFYELVDLPVRYYAIVNPF